MALGFLLFLFDLRLARFRPGAPASFFDTNSTINRPTKGFAEVSLWFNCRKCMTACKSLIWDDSPPLVMLVVVQFSGSQLTL